MEEAYSCLQNVDTGAQGTARTENLLYLLTIALEREESRQEEEVRPPPPALLGDLPETIEAELSR